MCQLIYADKAQGGALYKRLRVASKSYRKRYGHYDHRGKIKNKGDTVMGKGRKSALLTMVERKILYSVMVRLTGVRSCSDSHKCLQTKVKTITFDNGLEFADHGRITEGLGADI